MKNNQTSLRAGNKSSNFNDEFADTKVPMGTKMIDKDGIERPDDPHGHMLTMPTKKQAKAPKIRVRVSFNKMVRFLSYCLRLIVYVVLMTFYKFKYRIRFKGKQYKRSIKGKAAIVVGNHCHMLDVTFYALAMMPQMTFITSIPQNFYIPIAGSLVKALGGFATPWDLKSAREFKTTVDDILRRKKSVVFLPEASMWPFYRDLRPFKNGAFKFSVKNNVPIMPTVVLTQIVHKSLKKKKHRFTVESLPLVYPDSSLPESEAIEKIQNEVHQNMKNRLDEEYGKDIYSRKYLKQKKKLS